MSIKVTARDFELPDYLEEHIKIAFSKFDKFNISFISIDVFIKFESEHKFIVEVATKSNLGQTDSNGESKEMMEGFNEAFSRLERLLIKKKEKPLAHRSEHAKTEKDHLINDEDDELK